MTWRVHADPSMALAGLRALLLQAVHPVAMHGVASNSQFRSDPWGRLQRTADYVGAVTYGTTSEAEALGERVRRIHSRIGGTDPVSGRSYRADDPDLLLWVHCSEVESFLSTALRSGLHLSGAEQDRYYLEQTRSAALVGLDPATVPSSRSEVSGYFEVTLPELRVGAEARAAARFILWPPMPAWVALSPARLGWLGLGLSAAALLPGWARRLYDLPGLPATDVVATALGRALRSGVLVVPEGLWLSPHLRAARERLAAAPLPPVGASS